MKLQAFFAAHPRAALAFSGGVDSSYLLCAARECGCDIHAYFIKSPFQPQFELDDATRLATQLAVPFTVTEYDILQNSRVAANPANRCYYCKTALFEGLWALARADGYDLLLDGTNASDQVDDRPGMKSLAELGVRSPLRECGLTKVEIRRLSEQAGLFTFDKPSYACLATRVPTDTPITHAMLKKIERGEDALFRLGFSDLRLRVVGNAAKLQLPADQLIHAVENRKDITDALAPDFEAVTLDLKPR